MIHEVAAEVRVCVTRPMPSLAPSLEAEIDRHWAAAQAHSGGRLFNGRVFSADVITPRLICGHWTEYRREVAQIARPDLYPVLGLRALAVGGVVVCPDGVVFGRRPRHAIYQAGEWQLPPAGSVDGGAARPEGRVDIGAALVAELEEELGLHPVDIHTIRPLCLVEHAREGFGSHVLDLGFALHTALPAGVLRARHAGVGNDEYAALEIVALADLAGFMAREAATMNLQAPIFLARAGLLPGR